MNKEVGEYIRTSKGEFGKILRINKEEREKSKLPRLTKYLIDYGNGKACYRTKMNNVKHSKNIIDLIEVGDYVNGYLIADIKENDVCYEEEGQLYSVGDIKTIVTKEQFKEMEYRINE